MYLSKVELHNFGIYKGSHEICFDNENGSKNIFLIGGLNGRGKTTFHDAILLSLYGKQALKYINENVRSYDKLLVDYINKNSTDGITYIAVTIFLDDGTELRIKRAWQLKGRKVEQDIVVEKDGVFDKYLAESWNYYIEEILPFGIARFFFFNNEKITQLADDKSFEQIKSSIKSAIGVASIEKAIEHTEEVIRRKRNALQTFEKSETHKEYDEVEAQISEIDIRLKEYNRRAAELERRCKIAETDLRKKEEEFWASGGDLGRNRDAIQNEMQRAMSKVKNIKEEILQLSIDASTPLYLCKKLVVQSYDAEKDYQKSESKAYSNLVICDLHTQLLERLRASALKDTSLALVEDILDDVFSGHTNFDLTQKQAQNMSATSMMLYERLITSDFRTIRQRIESLVKHIVSKENEFQILEAHLEAADEKSSALRLLEVLRATERKKVLIDNELQKLLESIESLKRQRELLGNKRIHLIKQIADKETANDDNARIIKYAVMSIEVLNEFKIRLQREKIIKLSETVTYCFKELVEKNSLVSDIQIDATTLDVKILGTNGSELLKHQLSAGEQQMFAISIVWALALTSGYKAPVIIDTPMARLDSSHRANFVTKYLPAASSQVIVLSTDEEVYGRYLDLIRDSIADYFTLIYEESEQCASIVHGYFGEI